MKTHEINPNENILEIRLAQHASRLDKIHSLKLVILISFLALFAMLSVLL